MRLGALLAAFALVLPTLAFGTDPPHGVTISIVTTTDIHGNVFARGDRGGGLALFGGYLANLRAARAADGGAVVLVDSGDTFQGGIESNLSEGAIVVDGFAALGYTAVAIGNHELDFGHADGPGARQTLGSDPRGAIRAAAARAPFPFLAANLVDGSGRPIDWTNVRPSVLVEAAEVKVGIVGVMTIDALRATLRANVHGLRTAPLAGAVETEAAKLRSAGAEIVLVVAHAGGACGEFDSPRDLTSCDPHSEIFELARALPPGLVDAIAAGHTHQAVAHEVAGVAIVQGYPLGLGFGRVDLEVDRDTRRVVRREPFAPRAICALASPSASSCEAPPAASGSPFLARYEGAVVTPDAKVEAAMAGALAAVRALQAAPLGVVLDTPFPRGGGAESPLGNLFADALRERSGADVAFNNNVRGGLRADLPAGPLTFGRLYDAFPFDNRLLTLTLTGAQLRAIVAEEIRRNRPGALAIAGAAVQARCTPRGLEVDLLRASGSPVRDDDALVVAAMDSLVLGQAFAPARLPEGITVPENAPVMREVVEDWLRERPGSLAATQYVDAAAPRWPQDAGDLASCPPAQRRE